MSAFYANRRTDTRFTQIEGDTGQYLDALLETETHLKPHFFSGDAELVVWRREEGSGLLTGCARWQ